MSPLTLFAGAMGMNIVGSFLDDGKPFFAGAMALCVMGFAVLVRDWSGGNL